MSSAQFYKITHSEIMKYSLMTETITKGNDLIKKSSLHMGGSFYNFTRYPVVVENRRGHSYVVNSSRPHNAAFEDIPNVVMIRDWSVVSKPSIIGNGTFYEGDKSSLFLDSGALSRNGPNPYKKYYSEKIQSFFENHVGYNETTNAAEHTINMPHEYSESSDVYCPDLDLIIYYGDKVGKVPRHPYFENIMGSIKRTADDIAEGKDKSILSFYIVDNNSSIGHKYTVINNLVFKVNVIEDHSVPDGLYVSNLENSGIDISDRKYDYYAPDEMYDENLFMPIFDTMAEANVYLRSKTKEPDINLTDKKNELLIAEYEALKNKVKADDYIYNRKMQVEDHKQNTAVLKNLSIYASVIFAIYKLGESIYNYIRN